jgi:hypothetical protein
MPLRRVSPHAFHIEKIQVGDDLVWKSRTLERIKGAVLREEEQGKLP